MNLKLLIDVAGALVALGLGMIPSCASTSVGGTDSNTHWLDQCRTDKDCGLLQCRCGGCTKACSVPADCASLGATAACATTECSLEPKLCVATCSTSADCPHGGSGFECRGGQCMAASIDGGQNAGSAPVDGGICPASAVSGAPCDGRIGRCFTQCIDGLNSQFGCDAGHWVAGHGVFPCGGCPDGIKGGDACSSADSRCFTPCVSGLRGQYFCSSGAWVAGKGLFSCTDTVDGSVSADSGDAGKDP